MKKRFLRRKKPSVTLDYKKKAAPDYNTRCAEEAKGLVDLFRKRGIRDEVIIIVFDVLIELAEYSSRDMYLVLEQVKSFLNFKEPPPLHNRLLDCIVVGIMQLIINGYK